MYLRDIYKYYNNGGGANSGQGLDTPNTSEMDDASFYSQFLQNRPDLQYLGGGDQGPRFGFTPGGFLDQLSQKGQASLDGRKLSFKNLPTTKFGSIEYTIPVEDGVKLLNPNMVYDDPNYGKITHIMNKDRGKSQMLGPALMALVGAGMGGAIGAAGGANAASGFNTAKGMFGGLQGTFNKNPGALLGMIPGLGSMAGLGQIGSLLSNPATSMAAKYFLANALRNRKKS
jgi:hypothetical protein